MYKYYFCAVEFYKIGYYMKRTIVFSSLIAVMAVLVLSGCDRFMKVVSIKTLECSNLGATSVVLKGQVVSDAGSELDERGFFYGTSKNLRDHMTAECGPGGKGDFESQINGLLPNTKYYYQAYAKGEDDLDVGDIMEFTTYDLKITVTTDQPNVASPENVTFSGSYVNEESFEIEKVGFEYSRFGDYSNSTVVYSEGTATPFSAVVSLSASTTYYCRAFIQAQDSTILLYGESLAFATTEYEDPVVTTLDAENITATSARLKAEITANGNNINNKGYYWSTTSDFTPATTHQEWSGGAGAAVTSYEILANNLTPSTTYYYKASIQYSKTGQDYEIYGEVKSFTTPAE